MGLKKRLEGYLKDINFEKIEIYVNDEFNNSKDCLWSIEELQAINKQIEELGWYDEYNAS